MIVLARWERRSTGSRTTRLADDPWSETRESHTLEAMLKWLRHAFAVEPPGPIEPTPLQQPAVDWACIQIAKRRLTTPGLMALEMSRPLNYIAANVMHIAQPVVWAMLPQERLSDYEEFARFLERRGSIEYLARRVEHFEGEFTRLEERGQPVGAFITDHMAEARAAAAQSREASVPG